MTNPSDDAAMVEDIKSILNMRFRHADAQTVNVVAQQIAARHRLAALTPPARVEGGARDIASVPKDGTMVRLLVDYTDGGAPLDDAERAWTIGFNNLGNTGEDRWQFAGWCWTQDHFTHGSGEPVGWLPWSNPSAGGDTK